MRTRTGNKISRHPAQPWRMLLGVFFLALTLAEAQAFWGSSNKREAEAALNEAMTLVQAADDAWRAGNADAAIERYARAINALAALEAGKSGQEAASLRFRQAYCETQIDQIKFNQASKVERRMTVMHTPTVAPATNLPVVAATRPLLPRTEPVPAEQPAPVNLTEELAWARDMDKIGRKDEAAATLIRILKGDPANRPARLMLAIVRCRQQAFEDALIILEDLRDEGEDEAVLLALASAYCGTTRYYEALLSLDKVLTLNPRHADATMNMAYLLLEMSPNRRQDAELYYRQAVKLGAVRDEALERRLGL